MSDFDVKAPTRVSPVKELQDMSERQLRIRVIGAHLKHIVLSRSEGHFLDMSPMNFTAPPCSPNLGPSAPSTLPRGAGNSSCSSGSIGSRKKSVGSEIQPLVLDEKTHGLNCLRTQCVGDFERSLALSSEFPVLASVQQSSSLEISASSADAVFGSPNFLI